MASRPVQNADTPKIDKSDNDGYLLLVEFAHKHLDFLLPELLSVLEMSGIFVRDAPNTGTTTDDDKEKKIPDKSNAIQCSMIPLPNQEVYKQETKAAPRRAFAILKFPAEWYQQKSSELLQETNCISTMLSRCMLVKRVIELWGMPDTTMDRAAQNTRDWIQNSAVGKSVFQSTSQPSSTWKMTIHTLGSKYTRQEQDDMRMQFSFLEFPGRVQMKEPTHEFLFIREMELDTLGNPLYPRHGQQGKTEVIPENDRRPPLACYFGRVLLTRENFEQYELKRRSYLGPTSMDAELSFVMANLGHVQRSVVVLDPFVGTGSILLSCALRGAYCVGTDIDIRVLRGRGTEENVFSNFAQFQLPRPELIRSDNALYHRHFRTVNTEPWVDAIVTDPPYGIRAGARKSGSRLEQPRPVQEQFRHNHIAQTQPYSVSDVMADLLDVAARILVKGGRLVYVIPSFATDFDCNEDLPQHPCLKVVHLSYQPFTMELGRRMVTMRKVQDYDPALRDAYLSKAWKNGPASAEKCANIRDKILEAAKQKPGYEEKARYRKQKRIENKKAKKRAKLEEEHGTTEGKNRDA